MGKKKKKKKGLYEIEKLILLQLDSGYACTLNSRETTKMQCKPGYFQSQFLMLSPKYILTQHYSTTLSTVFAHFLFPLFDTENSS